MSFRENLYHYTSMFFGVIYLLAFCWIFISAILSLVFCLINTIYEIIPVEVIRGVMVSFGLSFGVVFLSFLLAEAFGSAFDKEVERMRAKRFDLR